MRIKNGLKTCSSCKEEKTVENFTKDLFHSDNLSIYCKLCQKRKSHEWYVNNKKRHGERRLKYERANKDKVNARHRKWRTNNVDKNKRDTTNGLLVSAYGITLEQRNQMLLKQSSLCLICEEFLDINIKRAVHVDHDHKTGKIRGLLCPKCNLLLGHARDNISILQSAIRYLKNNTKEGN